MTMQKKHKIFYGIQAKVILFITIALGLLFSVTFLGVNEIARSERFDSLTQQNELHNEMMKDAFAEIMEELDNLTAGFILNDYVQKSLTNQIFTFYDKEMMKKSLSFQSEGYWDYYLVIDNKGNFYSQAQIELDMQEFYASDIYKCLGEDYSETKLIWSNDAIFGTGEKSFFAVRYIREMNTIHEPGILILKLDESILEGIRLSISDNRFAYFIIDGDGEVCFGQLRNGVVWNEEDKNSREMFQQSIMPRIDNCSKQRLKYGILNVKKDDNTDFKMITYIPPEVSMGVIKQIQIVLAIVFIAAYTLGLLVTATYVRRITRPIKYLSETMSGFDESNLNQTIHLNTNTELDQIGNAYNNMLDRVGMLMSDVQRKERELRKSELQSLMYQIRPHFLYNTLDTIYMLARISKEETIMKMIQSLSRFLRINLSNGNEEIPVKKELEHVGAYLEIQKIRNADLFEYEIVCEEKLQDYAIMKMILQPVAENCIKYGFRNIYDGGKIKISAYMEEDKLCLSIANNGEIIDEQQLVQLNQLQNMNRDEIDKVTQCRQGGYGISNVVRRLRMRYSDKVKFFYVVDNGWTICKIHIDLECINREETHQ